MMRWSGFFLPIGLCAIEVTASNIPPPIPTATEYKPGGGDAIKGPAPTAKPLPLRFGAMELMRRQDLTYSRGNDTCGFGSDRPWITYKCYSSVGDCMNIGSYRGCCTGGYSECLSTIWTECQAYTASASCGLHTRCCQSASPYCFTWLYSEDAAPDATYTVFDCNTASDDTAAFMVGTPINILSSIRSASSHRSSSTTSATTSSATSSEQSSGSTSSTPIGAIVGGVVGGVVLIALIIAGIFFMKRYSKNKHAPAPAPTSPPPPTIGPSEMGDTMHSPATMNASYFGQSASPQSYNYMSLQPGHHPQQGFYKPPDQPVIHEAPNTPAAGYTDNNRAELN